MVYPLPRSLPHHVGTRRTLIQWLSRVWCVSGGIGLTEVSGVVIVLSREQAAEVALLSADLDVPEDEVVRLLLSGPLGRWMESGGD